METKTKRGKLRENLTLQIETAEKESECLFKLYRNLNNFLWVIILFLLMFSDLINKDGFTCFIKNGNTKIPK